MEMNSSSVGAEFAAPTGLGNWVAWVAAKISLRTELREKTEFNTKAQRREVARENSSVLCVSAPLRLCVKTLGGQRAQAFLQAFLERAADGHRFADAFHLRGERRVGLREFLEGEARNLGDDVINARLEARGGFARDVVFEFVEQVADGEFGGLETGARRSRRFTVRTESALEFSYGFLTIAR
jgi:hypothetical protein